MNPSRPSHLRVVSPSGTDVAALRTAAEPHISVRRHRQLRGPYTGGGALLRDHVVPELLERAADLVTPRTIEIIALAPELAPRLPSLPSTLTEHAEGLERTRYYAASRSRRLAHGIAELLTDWATAGSRADWRAHLAAYGAGCPSPHLAEIRRQEASLDLDERMSKVLP